MCTRVYVHTAVQGGGGAKAGLVRCVYSKD